MPEPVIGDMEDSPARGDQAIKPASVLAKLCGVGMPVSVIFNSDATFWPGEVNAGEPTTIVHHVVLRYRGWDTSEYQPDAKPRFRRRLGAPIRQ